MFRYQPESQSVNVLKSKSVWPSYASNRGRERSRSGAATPWRAHNSVSVVPNQTATRMPTSVQKARAPVPFRTSARDEDERDMGAHHVAHPHPVERGDDPRAEILREALRLVLAARAVHHDRARVVGAPRVAEARDP